MAAITEKMCELARKKEEEQRQQARDSDTLSTIVVPPVSADLDQVNRSTAPTRPDIQRYRGVDVDRVPGGVLRRVETALAAGSVGDRTAERPRVDRAASDGDDSDDGVKDVIGGRPGQLKRWPAPTGFAGVERGTAGRQDDDDDDESSDDDQSQDNNNRRPAERHVVPPASLQSTLTATPDDSQAADSSLALQKQLQNDLTVTDSDEKPTGSRPAGSIVSRATVI